MHKKYLIAVTALTYTLPVLFGDEGGMCLGLVKLTLFFGGGIMLVALLLQYLTGNTRTTGEAPRKLNGEGIVTRALAWPTIVFPVYWVLYRLGETGVLDFRVDSNDIGLPFFSFGVALFYAILVFAACFIGSIANENR